MGTLLTETELEADYRIPKKTAQYRCYRGLPPKFLKVGGRVLYRRSDVEAWLATCERKSTSDQGESAGAA